MKHQFIKDSIAKLYIGKARYCAKCTINSHYKTTWSKPTWEEAYKDGLIAFGKNNYKVVKL